MQVRPLLPNVLALQCEDVKFTLGAITIFVTSVLPTSRCPLCGQASDRIHSHYTRKLADLPWHGVRVQLHWKTRRFFCNMPGCKRRIFTERLPEVAASHAQRTSRLDVTLRAVGFACGGEGGARLAERLGMRTSPDTLLREIRRTALLIPGTSRAVGVDDWAFRRGQRYGTIVCDLERHRPVDLLPERSSQAFSSWLQTHPGVEVISRDRGDYYIKGATEGAPQAVQVADRWHLLHNLQESLTRMLDRYPQQLTDAATVASHRYQPTALSLTEPATASESQFTPRVTRAEEAHAASRARRLQRYQRVQELHQQKVSHREIARRLGIHRSTVRRLAQAGGFTERAHRQYASATDPFVDYLHNRWQEGCRNAVQLTKELREQGFHGSYDMVRRRVGHWGKRRKASGASTMPSHPAGPRAERLSSRRVAWLLVKSPTKLKPEEEVLLTALHQQGSQFETSATLSRQFVEIVQKRHAQSLDDWIARACAPEVPMELHRFAKGLQEDLSAVRAALSLPWSNGQVEGQVNRLKLIKRQMFGRAKFDLLRQRVLYAG